MWCWRSYLEHLNGILVEQKTTDFCGIFSDFSSVKSGVPQGSVLGPFLFILYTSDLFNNVKTNTVAYADDVTLYSIINSPDERDYIANLLNDDLVTISNWCSLWGMQLNPSKCHSMIVSRSRTVNPPHPPLFINDVTLNIVHSLKLLGVLFDSKFTFERHLRTVSSSISQKIGILRKCSKIYANDGVMLNCFFSFILPFYEYCIPVWMSSSDSHVSLLDRSFRNIKFIIPDLNIDLSHRRKVSIMCILYKIYNNERHPLHYRLPGPIQCVRPTRYNTNLNNKAFHIDRYLTNQFSRSFIPYSTNLWNTLPQDVVSAENVEVFKRKINRYLLGI